MDALSVMPPHVMRDEIDTSLSVRPVSDHAARSAVVGGCGRQSGATIRQLRYVLGADAGRQARTVRAIDRAIIEIDRLLSQQLNNILHHPRFQRLEASWRGLHYLTETLAEHDATLYAKVKMLNVSWFELARDITRALEFDQSHIFRRIYSDEFDTPGGEPFGVLIGDYQISHRPRPGEAASDIDVLYELGQIATAALCPFLASASARLFGVDAMTDLVPFSLEEMFQQREYQKWRRLRSNEASRFIGIVVPRVLMRAPWCDDGTRHERFVFREDVSTSREHYLWGSPCYALGGVLIRAFANTGWFADIRGGLHEFGDGGVVRGLHYPAFDFDRVHSGQRPATDLQIDDFSERELSDQGFIPLCSRAWAPHTAFYSNSSLHESDCQGSEAGRANARIAGMIQYMLCVSRFGHYLKIIGRDKIGSFVHAEECQRLLQNWLNQYTVASETTSSELRARYPLAASQVEINELPGRPGYFSCVVHLQPHFQMDQLVSSIRLVTELAVGTVAAAASA